MDWFWPLKWKDFSVPVPDGDWAQAAFGAVRKYDTHTGVDLYCSTGDMVRAVEDGVVVAIEHFTGAPESPWWNPTEAVLVEGKSGVVVYGEIEPLASIEVGAKILRKQAIGTVLRVIKNGKPGQRTTMLHLELHKPGTTFTEAWVDKRPETLLDPTPFLLKSFANPVEPWENPRTAVQAIEAEIEYASALQDRLRGLSSVITQPITITTTGGGPTWAEVSSNANYNWNSLGYNTVPMTYRVTYDTPQTVEGCHMELEYVGSPVADEPAVPMPEVDANGNCTCPLCRPRR